MASVLEIAKQLNREFKDNKLAVLTTTYAKTKATATNYIFEIYSLYLKIKARKSAN